MTTKDRLEALISGNEDAVAGLAELGFVRAEAAEQNAREEGRKEGIAAGLAQAEDIMDVAMLDNVPMELSASIIEKGVSREEAVTAIQQYRVNLSAGAGIVSTITPLSGDGKHPLIANVEKLAAAYPFLFRSNIVATVSPIE